MNIILIGFKSCGKSTIGQALAMELKMTFVDTDTLVEQMYAAQTGESLPFREIFRQHGRDYFTHLEQSVLTELATRDGYVIATGGGTVIHGTIPPLTRRQSTVVYLAVSPEVLWPRIKEGGLPSFFKTDTPQQEFYNLFRQRAPIYQEIADTIIEVSHGEVGKSVAQVKAAVQLD